MYTDNWVKRQAEKNRCKDKQIKRSTDKTNRNGIRDAKFHSGFLYLLKYLSREEEKIGPTFFSNKFLDSADPSLSLCFLVARQALRQRLSTYANDQK